MGLHSADALNQLHDCVARQALLTGDVSSASRLTLRLVEASHPPAWSLCEQLLSEHAHPPLEIPPDVARRLLSHAMAHSPPESFGPLLALWRRHRRDTAESDVASALDVPRVASAVSGAADTAAECRRCAEAMRASAEVVATRLSLACPGEDVDADASAAAGGDDERDTAGTGGLLQAAVEEAPELAISLIADRPSARRLRAAGEALRSTLHEAATRGDATAVPPRHPATLRPATLRPATLHEAATRGDATAVHETPSSHSCSSWRAPHYHAPCTCYLAPCYPAPSHVFLVACPSAAEPPPGRRLAAA